MARKKMRLIMQTEMTHADVFEEFIRHKKIIGLAEETINAYKYNYKYLGRFMDVEHELIKDIDPKILISDYVEYLRENTDIKPTTIATYIRHIVPVLKYAASRDYIENFTAEYPKYQEPIKEIYTEWELKTLLKKPINPTYAQYRNWVLVNFLLGTGVRAKELRNIKLKHLNLSNGLVLLTVTKNKKQRYVPLSSTLVSVLSEYVQYRGDDKEAYLFCSVYGEMLTRTTLQYTIRKYALARGVSRFSLHLFRHTYASHYISAGGNPIKLKAVLGHSTMKMVNHYVNLSGNDLVSDIDAYNPLEKFTDKNIRKVASNGKS